VKNGAADLEFSRDGYQLNRCCGHVNSSTTVPACYNEKMTDKRKPADTDAKKFLEFAFQESFAADYSNARKERKFKELTKHSSNLFLRGGDIISGKPQILGTHEPVITSLINFCAHSGYADFLLDIGANIGLISCQCGNNFDQVHMFEPNPYCCKILEVNCVIALNDTQYQIHNYGLGEENTNAILTVPRRNWGGAFVNDGFNAYDEQVLARKDEFESMEDANYFPVKIEIRNTAEELTKLFVQLAKKNLGRGVIKIDVEGYEATVLKGIAEALPAAAKAVIVFESWDSNFDMARVLRQFRGRAAAYKLVRELPLARWGRGLKLLLNPNIRYRLARVEDEDWRGDLILQID